MPLLTRERLTELLTGFPRVRVAVVVDFFLDRKSAALYVNEVNTIPGFTAISMYPKMWEASGLNATSLVTRLLELAIERRRERRGLKTSI